MSKAAKFREYAHDCIELAEKTTSGSYREMMLSVASTWMVLADQAQREAELQANDRNVTTDVGKKPDEYRNQAENPQHSGAT